MYKPNYMKKLCIIFVCLLLAILGGYKFYIPVYYHNIFNLVSLIGSYITIWGFGITIYQIYKLKSISQATQGAVSEARDKWDYILFAERVSKYIVSIRLIKEYAGSNKYPLAREKLSDIKEFFIDLGYANNAIPEEMITKFKKLQRKIENDITSLEREDNFQIVEFNTNMEEIVTFLKHIENHIKNDKLWKTNTPHS